MTTIDHANYASTEAGFDPIGFARRALHLALHMVKMRSDRAALEATPDFLLKDMGISRSEIPHYTSMHYAMLNQGGMDTGNFR